MSSIAATWIKAILDAVRLSWQIQFALFVASLAVVILPPSWSSWLGVLELVNVIRSYCFMVALLMSVLLVINIAELITKHFYTNRNYMAVLRNLSTDEKLLLREYIEQDTKTQSFPMSHGVASGLRLQGVLFQASNLSHAGSLTFPFNMQPWAWNLLKKHPELLDADNRN